jgi:hypothetical protein
VETTLENRPPKKSPSTYERSVPQILVIAGEKKALKAPPSQKVQGGRLLPFFFFGGFAEEDEGIRLKD